MGVFPEQSSSTRARSGSDSSPNKNKSIGLATAVMGIVGGGIGSGWVTMEYDEPPKHRGVMDQDIKSSRHTKVDLFPWQ